MSKPRFVTLHPRDNGFGLSKAFWEHPDTFMPKADRDGRFRRWGLSPDTENEEHEPAEGFDIPAAMMRTMTTGDMYFNIPSPEKQFIKQLEALDTAELERSDYILKITLTGEESVKVWRRGKVSGGLSLAVLADKIITPLMGWTQNYHAHIWTDFKDGSVFGPKCETILPGSESNGKVEVLGGFGACPREDGKNVWNWKQDLDKLRKGSYKEKRDLLEEI
ncbi:hypothetical protein FS837_004106 [Tulasnella sp. UAMH 9824]|nr:hypothetical protein FS837_004106 [Tulasnella sp. UAMH 9824]